MNDRISRPFRVSVFDGYTSKTYTLHEVLTFVETRLFTSLVHRYISDDEYTGAAAGARGQSGRRQCNPRLGRRPGSSDGASPDAGTRGGIRVIYYSDRARAKYGCLTCLRSMRR